MTPRSQVWAILPIKSLDVAKQRLRRAMSADQRRWLMLISTRDVLTALCQSKRLAGILVVSKDPTAIELAREFGADTLIVSADAGQSDAVSRATHYLQEKGVTATLSIPGDTPLVSAADIDRICDTLQAQPALTLVSNVDGTGTNCIGASPPDLITYQFGRDSLRRHQNAARDAGIDYSLLDLPALELDIDIEADVTTLLEHPPRTMTQRFLLTAGLRVAS